MNPTTPQDDGGSAFPRTGFYSPSTDPRCRSQTISEMATTVPTGGMSLRDYFAAAALAPILARSVFGPCGTIGRTRYEGRDISVEELYAVVAYRMADAMLAERQIAANKPAEYAKGNDVQAQAAGGAP